MTEMWRVLFLSLVLVGCNWPGKDLQDYVLVPSNDAKPGFENELSQSEPGFGGYPERCDWLGFGRVVDGDTIVTYDENGQVRVRMIGIDTPESKREGTPVQDHALDASRELKNLIGNPLQVCLVQDTIGDQYDVYERRLSYVFTEDGLDLNAEMLRRGWARAYLRFPFDRKSEFAALERTAKDAKIGRWE